MSEVTIDRRQKRTWLQFPRVWVLIYSALFIVAELVGAYINVQAQIGVTAVLLLVTLNHAVFGFRNARTAAVVMSALFTLRLIVLTLPITGVSSATRTGVIGVFALLIARLASWVLAQDVKETRKSEGFPLKRALISPHFTNGLVIVSGVPLGLAAYELLDPAALIVNPLFGNLTAAWTLIVGLLALGAAGEELIYRRLVAAMVQHTGHSQTSLISGLIFAAAYLGTTNWAFIGLVFVTGTWFAWSCERTGSLKGPIIAHAIISVLVFVVLPSTNLL